MKIAMSLCKLNPVLDGEGILRVRGRLGNAAIDYDTKHQIILPYRLRVTNLIIQKYHREAGHLGQEHVLSSLRQLNWIIKGQPAVHQVLSECFLCRKLGATRGEELMANLPKERLTPEEPPFTSVGVDYFGQTIYFSSEQTLTCLLESLQRKTPTVITVGDRCNTCQTYFGNACSRNIYHLFN